MANEQVYFINQLYRDALLPDILGAENQIILYWAGKNLADKYQLNDLAGLQEFFTLANFGELTLLKEQKTLYTFVLSGQIVADRINTKSLEFSLETGIIAKAWANKTEKLAEANFEINEDTQTVTITAKTERKKIVEE